MLKAVETLSCGAADVLFQGRFAFSVGLNSDGLWVMFERDPDRHVWIVHFGQALAGRSCAEADTGLSMQTVAVFLAFQPKSDVDS